MTHFDHDLNATEMTAAEIQLMEALNAPYVHEGGARHTIPYAGTIGAVTVVGVLELRTPLEDSSTSGAVAGLVNGTYALSSSGANANLYGPFLRVRVEILLDQGLVRWRVDTQRVPAGGWNIGGWQQLVRF